MERMSLKNSTVNASTRYEVWCRNGKGGGLAAIFKTCQEAFVKMVETINTEREHGYTPLDYVIVEIKSGKELTEDGWFVSSYEKVTALYAYNGVDGTIKYVNG